MWYLKKMTHYNTLTWLQNTGNFISEEINFIGKPATGPSTWGRIRWSLSSPFLLFFGAIFFLVVLVFPALRDATITNVLKNNSLVVLLSPSSFLRTLKTTHFHHLCGSTSLTRDQTTNRIGL